MLPMTKLAVIVGALCVANAFYLPGVAPREYLEGEDVEIKVNKLDSVNTQLPYDYYSLPMCQPATISEASENLGEVLSGEKIETSPYKINMRKVESCKILCKKTMTGDEMKVLSKRIRDNYFVNMIVDNIPVAEEFVLVNPNDSPEKKAQSTDFKLLKGFPLGFVVQGKSVKKNAILAAAQKEDGTTAYINNHLRLKIMFHEDPESFEGFRIVGFIANAFSVKHAVQGEWKGADTSLSTCTPLTPIMQSNNPQPVDGAMLSVPNAHDIIFTYDVAWEASPIKWASRWDLYLKMTDTKIHWFAITNSIIVTLLITTVVAATFIRTLRGDLEKYNDMDKEEALEETGWKLVHGEVFRAPASAGFLSVLVGTGCQICAMAAVMLGFACMGLLSPANRGGLMTALLLLFVFFGIIAGYASTRMYKMFGMTEWKTNTVYTALFFPGVTFSTFFILNLFVWGQKSSGAVPFTTLLALLTLWLGISAPLVYLGSFFAFKKDAIKPPLRVNNIPRMLPPDDKRAFYSKPLALVPTAGLIVFSNVYFEVYYIVESVWMHQFFYMFGILAIIFLLLIVTCVEMCILMTYFQLCAEDYHWWWNSFLCGASVSFFVGGYSLFFFVYRLNITNVVSGILFFGYTFLACFALFVMAGAIGHIGAHLFVRKIYASIKID